MSCVTKGFSQLWLLQAASSSRLASSEPTQVWSLVMRADELFDRGCLRLISLSVSPLLLAEKAGYDRI